MYNDKLKGQRLVLTPTGASMVRKFSTISSYASVEKFV